MQTGGGQQNGRGVGGKSSFTPARGGKSFSHAEGGCNKFFHLENLKQYMIARETHFE